MNTLKKIFFIGFFLYSWLPISAYTERNLLEQKATLQTVKAALVLNQSWVTYPNYSDRAGWDRLMGGNKAFFIHRGERYLDYKWETVKATDYIEYEKSGNRRVMESPNDHNNAAIFALMMAELAEGQGRFLPQLINGVFHSCEMTSWVLSAHLSSIQNSHRALPNHNDSVIDLGSGGVGAAMSWIYYFFHRAFDKYDPEISNRLRDEIQHRILDTYMNNDHFWWMAFNCKDCFVNNWNPWCNSNVLLCFMLLENDKDKLANAVYRSMVSVDKYLNYIKEDGACEEGPSYWGAAAGKLFDYLQMLSTITGGKISLFDNPLVKRMGEYIVRSYVGNGWVVNFADASAKGGGDIPLIYRYGKAVNSTLMKGFAAYLNQQEGKPEGENLVDGSDSYRVLQALSIKDEILKSKPLFVQPRYSWYPQTEFCYMTNKSGLFVATKGGYNNESHNHNDVGTVSVYLNTMPILIDAGVGTYTRQTFSSERYNIWTMQGNYHNIPMINGVPESYGANYKAKNATFNSDKMTYSADIADAYPKTAEVSKWIRSCTLNKDKVVITDAFELKAAKSPNLINFLTWGDVDIATPGMVNITVNGQKAQLQYDKNKFSASKAIVHLTDSRLSNVWGADVYRVTLTANQQKLCDTYTYVLKQLK